MFVIWASAQSNTLNLVITATGGSFGRGKGICLQASTGTVEVMFPTNPYTYGYENTKTIGKVTSEVYYVAENLGTLTLEEEIWIHVHVDVPFRRLNEGESAKITLLEIGGCTSLDLEGVQYCLGAHHAIPSSDVGNIGTVTKTGPDTWGVDALIPAPEQGAQSLCVRQWSEGEIVDGFCIPLYGFEVMVTGTITK